MSEKEGSVSNWKRMRELLQEAQNLLEVSVRNSQQEIEALQLEVKEKTEEMSSLRNQLEEISKRSSANLKRSRDETNTFPKRSKKVIGSSEEDSEEDSEENSEEDSEENNEEDTKLSSRAEFKRVLTLYETLRSRSIMTHNRFFLLLQNILFPTRHDLIDLRRDLFPMMKSFLEDIRKVAFCTDETELEPRNYALQLLSNLYCNEQIRDGIKICRKDLEDTVQHFQKICERPFDVSSLCLLIGAKLSCVPEEDIISVVPN